VPVHLTRTPTEDRLPSPAVTARGDRRFRPDIQGLRCVAVVLVVLYHSGVPGLSGGYVGVDAFFVISGFLITRQLISEQLRTGRISIGDFYARRIKRLLPSALTVVATTVVAFRIWGPPLQSSTVARDGIFSTFYAINYRLAAAGVDYQNADGPVSPFQHFWSLAVEEQFYLLWPLLLLGTALLARRFIRTLGSITVLVVTASLVASIGCTRSDPTLAYFAIHTRGWELGVGGAVAIGTPLLLRRISEPVLTWSGWAGLIMIVLAAVRFTAHTPFPGSAAALPVAGAALIIVSGLSGAPGAGRERGLERILLGSRLPQFVGRISYGWYLWHWPVLILAPALLGKDLAWPEKLLASALGFGLAVLTNVLIEQSVARGPNRRWRWIGMGAGMSVAVTAVAVLVLALPPSARSGAGSASALNLPATSAAGLSTLLDAAYNAPAVPGNLTPALAAAVEDVPPTTGNGCHATFLVTTEPACVFGRPDAARTIVLFGDSHAEQWFGGLDALARAKGWRLVSWTKAACPLADVLLMSAQLKRSYIECPAWRKNTLARISQLHPDLVVAAGSDALPGTDYSNSTWASDTLRTLSALRAAADQVVYLADLPRPMDNVPVCLAANLRQPAKCQFTRESMTNGATIQNQLPARHAAVVAAVHAAGATAVDPTDWFCGTSGCPVTVRNTLVYRDATHMTQAYSTALGPVLSAALARTVPWMARS